MQYQLSWLTYAINRYQTRYFYLLRLIPKTHMHTLFNINSQNYAIHLNVKIDYILF